MKNEYIPQKIEPFIQEYWKKNKTFQVTEDSKKEKYYCLPMMPYPSGKLHMGHVRNYTISDVISRYQRMLGKNVLQPIGWDAFGLPAEEAAIRNNTPPLSWTIKNIKYMKKQLQSLGFSYDWNREITTCKSEYYLWEQWFFIKLYEKNLVYKKNSLVNWCIHDNTVLANEQVIDGRCWRCQNKVKIKKIPQWFLRIRKYAEHLYQDLKKLDNWPENVKNMQRHWIGRKKGFEIIMKMYESNETIKVFLLKLNEITETSYISISINHTLSIYLSQKNTQIKNFIKKHANRLQYTSETKDYQSIETHIFAINPITEKKIPIWITNFVQKEYGTDAVFSVFKDNAKNMLHTTKNTSKIKEILLKKNFLRKKICYTLQDWCISRQRYWGAPIPMAKFKNGKITPIPEKQLPVILPKIKNHSYFSINRLNSKSDWANIIINNKHAIRETDTFDTFMESSWYYARYTSPHFKKGIINPKASKYWLPVDQYIGGIEHAIMHLMYFRFYHKLLRDFKLVESDEPVKSLLCQGMVLSEAFYYITNKNKKNWINKSEVIKKRNKTGEIVKLYTQEGKNVISAGMIKMSKSKNNGVEPENMIKLYGADTIRLFIMFAAPVESSLEWKESGVKGVHRFLKKLWLFIFNYLKIKNKNIDACVKNISPKQKKIIYQLHFTIYKVSNDISERKTFNTAISSMMKFFNYLAQTPITNKIDQLILQKSLICLIKMLYPFTPHFCCFIWKYFDKNTPLDQASWPVYNKKILSCKSHNIIVQINGKLRYVLKSINNQFNKEEIILKAKKIITIQKYLQNKNIKKIIYIPQKLINFVI